MCLILAHTCSLYVCVSIYTYKLYACYPQKIRNGSLFPYMSIICVQKIGIMYIPIIDYLILLYSNSNCIVLSPARLSTFQAKILCRPLHLSFSIE